MGRAVYYVFTFTPQPPILALGSVVDSPRGRSVGGTPKFLGHGAEGVVDAGQSVQEWVREERQLRQVMAEVAGGAWKAGDRHCGWRV